MTDWTAYERQWERQKPAMKAFIEAVALPFLSSVWEDNGDDYGFGTQIERPDRAEDAEDDEGKLDITLQIWDSGDADDGIYGVHGNFVCDITEAGGRIVGGFTPNNYTDRVWVDYSDDDEFDARMAGITSLVEKCREVIAEWLAGK
jgi:hypothetical protein